MTKPRYVNPECPNARSIIEHARPAVTQRIYLRVTLQKSNRRQFAPIGWLCAYCNRAWTDYQMKELAIAAAPADTNRTVKSSPVARQSGGDQRDTRSDSKQYQDALYDGLMHQ